MSSHDSSTVFCSPRIKKFSTKMIRSAAHSQSTGSTKIQNCCYCEQKSRQQNLREITKKISKSKNRQISIKQFNVHFMKKNSHSVKKASHFRKKLKNSI